MHARVANQQHGQQRLLLLSLMLMLPAAVFLRTIFGTLSLVTRKISTQIVAHFTATDGGKKRACAAQKAEKKRKKIARQESQSKSETETETTCLRVGSAI